MIYLYLLNLFRELLKTCVFSHWNQNFPKFLKNKNKNNKKIFIKPYIYVMHKIKWPALTLIGSYFPVAEEEWTRQHIMFKFTFFCHAAADGSTAQLHTEKLVMVPHYAFACISIYANVWLFHSIQYDHSNTPYPLILLHTNLVWISCNTVLFQSPQKGVSDEELLSMPSFVELLRFCLFGNFS